MQEFVVEIRITVNPEYRDAELPEILTKLDKCLEQFEEGVTEITSAKEIRCFE